MAEGERERERLEKVKKLWETRQQTGKENANFGATAELHLIIYNNLAEFYASNESNFFSFLLPAWKYIFMTPVIKLSELGTQLIYFVFYTLHSEKEGERERDTSRLSMFN